MSNPTHKMVNGIRVPLDEEEKLSVLREWDRNAVEALLDKRPTIEDRLYALEKRGA